MCLEPVRVRFRVRFRVRVKVRVKVKVFRMFILRSS
jgi:hypothetical protein